MSSKKKRNVKAAPEPPAGRGRPCFICGNNKVKTVYKKIPAYGGFYDIDICPQCGLGKTIPQLDDERLGSLYSTDDYRGSGPARFFSLIESVLGSLMARRGKSIERLVKPGRILEVGCGDGAFLAEMKERGWDAIGIDLDTRAVDRGRAHGLNISAKRLEDAAYPSQAFEAVTFWHSFEHMSRPEIELAEAGRILKPGGALVMAVPNSRSLQARLTGKHWFFLDPPFHLYHYSEVNLRVFLEKHGFETVEVKHFSLEYGVLGFLYSIYNASGFKRNVLHDFIRSRGERGFLFYLDLFQILITLPILIPVAFVMAGIEALQHKGGSIEVYARKKI